MNRYIIVYYDKLASSHFENVIYDGITKSEAFNKFDEEFGIDDYPIINIIQL